MKQKTAYFLIGGVILCILGFLLIRSSTSSTELSHEKFVEVYVELSIAKEIFAVDSAKLGEEKGRIFKEAGVTPQEMDDFAKKLNQKPGEWAEVWKKIVERLEQKREELK
jgi:hypothetical protein